MIRRRARGTAADVARRPDRQFEPIKIVEVELGAPLASISATDEEGVRHGRARLVVRLHTLVGGHSTDDTIAVARALRPDVRVILQKGRGNGNALACGFAAATADIIVMIDADGSTDPAEIPRFLEWLHGGADFAKGSRFLPGGGSADITLMRALGNRALSGTVNLLFGTGYTDLCYGFNAFWRHCLPHMSVTCTGFEVETLINVRIARAGLNVAEVPSHEHARMHGESKLNAWRDGGRVLRTILAERVRHSRASPADWRPRYEELEVEDLIAF